MANEKTRALTGPRQLLSYVGNYIGTYDIETEQFPAYGNWTSIPPTESGILTQGVFSETRIDANLSLDRLTFFPATFFLQDPGMYLKSPSPVPDDESERFSVYDIVSTKQLNIPLIAQRATDTTLNTSPSMLGTEDDMNQITMGSVRFMAKDNNYTQGSSLQTTISVSDFSGAVPFAQDTIYCYRILLPKATKAQGGFQDMVIASPASRFVLQGTMGQEEELPYLMRLKNSYELLEKA
jgi:hypothetical protein